ncbi:MAG: hypothetical protein JSV08_05800 [Acidobacteriota bacterium]|nr:MAG: hypothetical protein JSV08_05800 [Acidobacteriota bacterium]
MDKEKRRFLWTAATLVLAHLLLQLSLAGYKLAILCQEDLCEFLWLSLVGNELSILFFLVGDEFTILFFLGIPFCLAGLAVGNRLSGHFRIGGLLGLLAFYVVTITLGKSDLAPSVVTWLLTCIAAIVITGHAFARKIANKPASIAAITLSFSGLYVLGLWLFHRWYWSVIWN